MKIIFAFGYVNRLDLLMKAIHSVKPFWPSAIVIDNSKGHDLRQAPYLHAVYEPPTPLTYSQSQNLLHRWGAEQKADVVIFMHNDAEAAPGTAERLLQLLYELQASGRRWGAVLTQWDTLAAYNMQAIREVGPWDTILPQAFAEHDYFRRLQLAGYEVVEPGLEVSHHDGGANTIKADPEMAFYYGKMFPLYERYYVAKWGGRPGAEHLTGMFGQFGYNPVKQYLKAFN
ncbi:glycosyltransferase family 2 protein [Paenibacillus sp. TRM 82003]|nr:glycosyltransferase family 2 protein [Paenibacillus sp. TRM 82003]